MIKEVFYLDKSAIFGIVRLCIKIRCVVLAIEKNIRPARGVGKFGIKHEDGVSKSIKIR